MLTYYLWRYYLRPLRRLLGTIFWLCDPSYGQCRSCKLPWWAVKSHSVEIAPIQTHDLSFATNGSTVPHTLRITIVPGCFALCRDCWDHLNLDERLSYHKEMCNAWTSTRAQADWPLIEAAIRRES